jgi:hypothetical protein
MSISGYYSAIFCFISSSRFIIFKICRWKCIYIKIITYIHMYFAIILLFVYKEDFDKEPHFFLICADILMWSYTKIKDWLIDYLQFCVPLKNFSLIWRRNHCQWRAAKFRPMLGAQGLWAGRDLYRATPALTRDLDFSGLIRRTAPFSRLLRHTRGCGGSILTRILTGRKSKISIH